MSPLYLTISGSVCCVITRIILSWGDASLISEIEHQAPNKYLETIKYPHSDSAYWDADPRVFVCDLWGQCQDQGAEDHHHRSQAWAGWTLEYWQSDHCTLLNLILIWCYSNQECFCDDATFFWNIIVVISNWPTVYIFKVFVLPEL